MGKSSDNNKLKMDIPIWRKLVFFQLSEKKERKEMHLT